MTSELEMETAVLDCECIKRDSFLTEEGGVIELGFLAPITSEGDLFFPESIYVRKEMCEVFKELIKSDRKQRQILIGSPGVGKSILLFLVALYRTLYGGSPGCFVRKTKDPQELSSVFLMKKMDEKEDGRTHITINYSRAVDPDEKVKDLLKHALHVHGDIEPRDALAAVARNDVILYIDGAHEGDADLSIPHHYLSTSGGFETPVGESARSSTLVVLCGWQKVVLGKALESTSDMLTRKTDGTADEDVDGAHSDAANFGSIEGLEADLDAAFSEETLEDIFYHTGGRIREAFGYAREPYLWMAEKKATIDRISKEQAMLSLVDTKGSGDPNSADRVRTMFRNEEGTFFGSALQVVDSQYYARLLQDRVGLEDYYNAYVHAKNRGLSSAAGCHFEELLHQLFHNRPNPIQSFLQSTGTGAGVSQLSAVSCYWIPSIPNFASIDAALVLKHSDDSVTAWTVWCLQYTVAKEHAFNSRTFVVKFLRPLLKNFGLKDISVKIVFVVPDDVYTSFKLPEGIAEDGYEGTAVFADCSSVDAVKGLFEKLEFIDKPVTVFDEEAAESLPDFDIDISQTVFLGWRRGTQLCIGELHYTNAEWKDAERLDGIFALVFALQATSTVDGAWTFAQGEPFTLVDMNQTVQVFLDASEDDDSLFVLQDEEEVRAALADCDPVAPGWRCVNSATSPRSCVTGLKAWLKAGAKSAGWDLSRIPVVEQTHAALLTAAGEPQPSSNNNMLLDLFCLVGAHDPLAPTADAETVEARCHERTALCAYVAWSVPTSEALAALTQLGPLLEVGAGTGYWASLLAARGVDIVALDLADSQGGQAFRFRHAMVQDGDGIAALADPVQAHRSLFLSWPDPVGDDATTDSDRDAFGVRCLQAFTGTTIAYIGELGPAVVRTKPDFGDVFPRGGSSASAAFQEALAADFRCTRRVYLPNWPPYNAHLTIWTRKEATDEKRKDSKVQGNQTKKVKR
jgi:hypothetical protein